LPTASFDTVTGVNADEGDRYRAEEETKAGAHVVVKALIEREARAEHGREGPLVGRIALVVRRAAGVGANPVGGGQGPKPDCLYVVEDEPSKIERLNGEERKMVLGVAPYLRVAAKLLL